ncbi:glycosyltransferase family 87 protein [Falsiroseomonas oryzae]|uniref:glycosyltransferase family 87 protein n=1 Tax=Falsiroseomonas oryzae TaxID=2766473 RepID=UPI0022EB7C7E|nr:glycosyltransferase family 87 protein [Roseomonas sp. MO-31]
MPAPPPLAEAARARIRLYGFALLLVYVLVLAVSALTRRWLVDAQGHPVPGDFVAFWSAGRLVLEGRAADAYDWALHKAVQVAAIGRDFHGHFAMHNPPAFLLLVTPFALPPYAIAWQLWTLVTAAGFALALRLVVPGFLIPALLAAPATIWCAIAGQNGFLTAGLMTACLALLERRPWLAGVFLGALTYKPQFGVLFPLFLIAGRRWQAFVSASLATLALAAIPTLLLGPGIWGAFLASMTQTGGALREGGAGWDKLQSIYAIAYRLVGDTDLALAAQLLAAAAILSALAWQWRRGAPFACQAAALAAASYLVTPYAYIYDAVVLTVAAAFLLRDGLERGFARHEPWLLVLGCALPAGFPVLDSLAAPSGALVLLGLAMRRGRAAPQRR